MFNRLKTKVVMSLTLALLVAGAATAATPSPSPSPGVKATGQFVSNDKKGSPFHKSTCASCKQIKRPQYYASTEDATKAGHKPCKACKP